MDEVSKTPLAPWEYQPVHNVFILAFAELGIAGEALFLQEQYGLNHYFPKKEKKWLSKESVFQTHHTAMGLSLLLLDSLTTTFFHLEAGKNLYF